MSKHLQSIIIALALLIAAGSLDASAKAAGGQAAAGQPRVCDRRPGLYGAVKSSSLPRDWSFANYLEREYYLPGQHVPYRFSRLLFEHVQNKRLFSVSFQWDAARQHLFVYTQGSTDAVWISWRLPKNTGESIKCLGIKPGQIQTLTFTMPGRLRAEELADLPAALQRNTSYQQLTEGLANQGYRVAAMRVLPAGAQSLGGTAGDDSTTLVLALDTAKPQPVGPAAAPEALEARLALAQSYVPEPVRKPRVYVSSSLRIRVPGKAAAVYERDYDSSTRTFAAHYDYLNGVPSWAPVGNNLALVPGKGIPTTTLATLLQLRTMGVREGSLEKANVTLVINERSKIDLRRQASEKLSADEIVAGTNTYQYMDTPLTQAGHRIVGVKINGARPAELAAKRGNNAVVEDYDMELELQPTSASAALAAIKQSPSCR